MWNYEYQDFWRLHIQWNKEDRIINVKIIHFSSSKKNHFSFDANTCFRPNHKWEDRIDMISPPGYRLSSCHIPWHFVLLTLNSSWLDFFTKLLSYFKNLLNIVKNLKRNIFYMLSSEGHISNSTYLENK